jgi:uncharacterized metal-binding protein
MAGCGCGCQNAGDNRLAYSCSGAANTGYLADSVARKFSIQGISKMTCLAAVAGGLSGFLESAKVSENIVIDGCPVSCGKRIFEDQGLPFRHFIMTDYNVEKGKTEITEAVIDDTVNKMAATVSQC